MTTSRSLPPVKSTQFPLFESLSVKAHTTSWWSHVSKLVVRAHLVARSSRQQLRANIATSTRPEWCTSQTTPDRHHQGVSPVKTHKTCSSCRHLKQTMVKHPDSSQLPCPDGPSTIFKLEFHKSGQFDNHIMLVEPAHNVPLFERLSVKAHATS